MRPDSKELAYRIDVMVSFQNKEDIQFREISRKLNEVEKKWASAFGNLAFNWESHEYRKAPPPPPVAREGYIFKSMLHQHPHDFRRETKEDTCFHVREVLGNE